MHMTIPSCLRPHKGAAERMCSPCTGTARSRKTTAPAASNTGPLRLEGTPGSNRRPSPWQREQTKSPTVPASHQPSPTIEDHSGGIGPKGPEDHQRSPAVHAALFHRCSKTVLGHSTCPRSRCSSDGQETRSARPASEETSLTSETISTPTASPSAVAAAARRKDDTGRQPLLHQHHEEARAHASCIERR